jgi:TATA-box binding protein (TBP) (component of TFIID and TFIIIB)
MSTIGDYVSRIEGTCGAESDVIVVLKFDKKDQALEKILKRAVLKGQVAGMIYDLTFEDYSFRFYASGKIIFRGIKNKQTLNRILEKLLL